MEFRRRRSRGGMNRSARAFGTSSGHTQRLEDLATEMLARGLSVRDIYRTMSKGAQNALTLDATPMQRAA